MNVNTVFDNLTNNNNNKQRKKKANDKIAHNAIIFEHGYFLIDITHSKKIFFLSI